MGDQTEETLLQLYQGVADHATAGIYVIATADHSLLYVNEAAMEVFGVAARQPYVGQQCFKLFQQADAPCAGCQLHVDMQAGKRWEGYFPRKQRWYSMKVHHVLWQGQDAAVVYMTDITMEKHAFGEVEQIYNNIPGAVFRCRFDDDWSVIAANDGLFTFLGYTREEFSRMGNRMAAVIYPDDLKIMRGKIMAQLNQGKTLVENENRLVCKDGTVKWISIRAQLLVDDDDTKYFYCVFVDITRQKQEEMRILEMEGNLAIAMQHANMLYWEFDIATSTVYGNEAMRTWFDIDKVLYDYPESYLSMGFVADEYVAIYRDAVNRVKAGAAYVVFDARIKTIQRGYEWMRVHMTCVKDDQGKPIRAICTAEIITEFKELEIRFLTTLRQNEIASWRYDVTRHTIMLNHNTYYTFAHDKNGEIANVPESQINEGLCYPEDVDILRRLYRRLDEGARRSEETLRFMDSRTGTFRWKKIIYTMSEDNRGNLTYAIGSALDVEAQIESQQNYDSAVEYRRRTQPDHLLLSGHCNVTKNRILEMTDLTGTSLAARFGTNRQHFFQSFETLLLNEDIKKDYERAFLNEGITQSFALGNHESQMTFEIALDAQRKQRRWVSMHIDTVRVPHTGDLEGFLTILDVTDMHMQERILTTVIDCDYDYVASINLSTDTVVLYQTQIPESEKQDFISGGNHSYQAFVEACAKQRVTPEDRDMFLHNTSAAHIRRALSRAKVFDFLCHVQDDAGHVRTKRGRFASYDPQSDTVLLIRSDVTDVLAQQEELNRKLEIAARQAREASMAKSAFLSRVSHDMRTPLNGILGLAALMQEKATCAEIQGDLTQLRLSAEYLLNVINDTLDVSKIENGRMELHPTVCDQQMLLNTVTSIVRPNLEEADILLRVHTEKRPSAILKADVSRIQQVFTNIIGNSIKFTPAGGTIDLDISNIEDGEDYLIDRYVIRDTGIGMKPDFLPHLFEAFSQEDTSRTNQREGTGLGMAIVKEIVTLMNGTIEVKSEVNVGTEFVFTLRLDKATPDEIAQWRERHRHEVDLTKLAGKRVLLCEDHPLNAQIATRLLERKQIQVEWAENGEKGVACFKQTPGGYYDLILMDIRMPVMDGLEATNAIRALPREDAVRIPIIAMTANALTEDAEACLKAGMNAHLSKPIQPDVMYETLARHMA